MESTLVYAKGTTKSPLRIRMALNGVVVDLVQIFLCDDVVWVGTPTTTTETCRTGLVFQSNGRVVGGPAVKFFATGGRHEAADLPDHKFRAIRAQLTYGFLDMLDRCYTEEQRAADRETLGSDIHAFVSPAFVVDDGDMSEKEVEEIAGLGVSQEVLDICVSHGFTIKPNLKLLLGVRDTTPEQLARRIPTYLTFADGPWDSFSEVAVLSSNLTCREVQVLKERGLHIVQAARTQPAKTAVG